MARNVPVLVDAGPLVALLSEEDEHHELCVKTIASLPRPLLSAWATFAEAAWLLQERPHHLESLLGTISEGAVAIAEFDPKRAAAPIQAILRQYRSLRSQLADAILLYLADELGTDRIFTLDRRDFSVYRLKRNRRIRIIPEIG